MLPLVDFWEISKEILSWWPVTTQIWVVSRHQCRISALVRQASFCRGNQWSTIYTPWFLVCKWQVNHLCHIFTPLFFTYLKEANWSKSVFSYSDLGGKKVEVPWHRVPGRACKQATKAVVLLYSEPAQQAKNKIMQLSSKKGGKMFYARQLPSSFRSHLTRALDLLWLKRDCSQFMDPPLVIQRLLP